MTEHDQTTTVVWSRGVCSRDEHRKNFAHDNGGWHGCWLGSFWSGMVRIQKEGATVHAVFYLCGMWTVGSYKWISL